MATDWNLTVQANLGLLWIQETMRSENQSIPVGDLLQQYMSECEGTPPINIGVLMMASYFLFLYPQQRDYGKWDLAKLDTSAFKIEPPSTTKKRFVERLRNSLAHANFHVDQNNEITFEDWAIDKNTKVKSDFFEATIQGSHFGDFINNFFLLTKAKTLSSGGLS